MSTIKRLIFAPKNNGCGADDDKFLTLAFQHGEVLSLEEFQLAWGRVGGEHFANYELRVMDLERTCFEVCPHCENEVELLTEFRVQFCPACGHAIVPCNLCFPDHTNCKDCNLCKIADFLDRDISKKSEFIRRLKQEIALAEQSKDEGNVLDLRVARMPYDAIKDNEVFSLDELDEVWDFIRGSGEWYVDIYENIKGDNRAEFTDYAVTSDTINK